MRNGQKGFYFDATRCIQCFTCEISCKVTNGLEPGIAWRRVVETWEGSFPDVRRSFFSKSCLHCEEPPCIPACSTGAIAKRKEDGIVVVDSEKCTGCRDCLTACPHDVPQFSIDGLMQKCDFCTGAGREPACTESCPAEALFSGTTEALLQRAEKKNGKQMEGSEGPSMILIR